MGLDLGGVGSLFVELRANMDKFSQDLNVGLERAGKQLQGVGRGLTAAVTLPLVGIGTAALAVASDAEEMQSKFNVVFGGMAESAKAWAETQATAMNRSSLDLQGYLATLQDTFVPLGFAGEQAAALSQQMVQLGVDLGSFNNIASDQAIANLTSALVGNHEAVRSFGIIITQATLAQELLNMGIEGGVQAATEQEKVLARMNIILGSTTAAQGDAARTSGSFANQMAGLKGQLELVGVALGDQILPAASKLVGGIANLARKLSTLQPKTQKTIVAFGAIAAALGPVALGIGFLLPLITGPVGLIAAFVAIGGAIAAFVTSSDIDMSWFKDRTQGVVDSVKGLWESVKVLFEEITDAIGQIWETHGDSLKTIADAFLTVLLTAMELGLGLISGAITTFTGLITGDWQTTADGLQRIWRSLWDAIKNILTAPIDAIKNKVKGFTEGVTGFFGNMFDKVVGNSFVPDMIDKIGDEFGRLDTEISPGIDSSLGGISGMFDSLGSSITGPGGLISGALDPLLGKFNSLIGSIPGLSSITGAFDSISSSVNDITTKIGDVVSGVGNIATGGLAGFAGGAIGGLLGGIFGGSDKTAQRDTSRATQRTAIDLHNLAGSGFWAATQAAVQNTDMWTHASRDRLRDINDNTKESGPTVQAINVTAEKLDRLINLMGDLIDASERGINIELDGHALVSAINDRVEFGGDRMIASETTA